MEECLKPVHSHLSLNWRLVFKVLSHLLWRVSQNLCSVLTASPLGSSLFTMSPVASPLPNLQISLLFFFYLCDCVGACMPQCTCEDHRVTHQGWVSALTMVVLGMKLRSSCLEVSAFTCSAILWPCRLTVKELRHLASEFLIVWMVLTASHRLVSRLFTLFPAGC